MIKLSKRQYYNEYFCQNINNSKKTFSGIKQIISLKQKTILTPSKLVINNIESIDKKIANDFNTYFANIGNSLSNEIPPVNVSPRTYFPAYTQSESFLLFATCSISKLNANKGTGPFSIPTKILKLLKDLFSKPLEILFNNCSFSYGVVHDKFEIARVLPVYKKGIETHPSNYRPISLF